MKKKPKERVIYSNYDLWEEYPDDYIKNIILEDSYGLDLTEEDITDDDIWRLRYREDEFAWEEIWCEILYFFKGKTVGFFGTVGLWNGRYMAGKIGDFEKLFYEATKDCVYLKFYDVNGHLHLTCSHHDGTNYFEIKEISDKGIKYLDNWEWGNDSRTEQYVHTQIFNRYSRTPRFAEKIWGCKRLQYEK